MSKKDIVIIILSILLIFATSFLVVFMDIAEDQAKVIEGYKRERC